MPRVWAFAALFAITFSARAQAAESLCAATEQTFFNCPLANSAKIVSVCGARNTSSSEGYIQYRFGFSGKTEFEYPNERKGSTEHFWWDGRAHSDVDDSWFWFRNGGYVYSVFYIQDHEQHRGIPKIRTGVMIEKKGDEKAAKTFKCAQHATGDFARLADIVQWNEVDD